MTTLLRRSQLSRRHIALGAEFEQIGDTLLVSNYGSSEEIAQAKSLALIDLSTLPRTGFKGAGATTWATSQGVKIPERPNLALLQKDQSLVVRLSYHELLILSNTDPLSTQIERLDSMAVGPQTYTLPRADSHCWLAVTGSQAAEMFSKVCGVDLRPHKFANKAVAQTSVDLGKTNCLYVLTDVSAAEFLWDCLLDAMLEYEGVPVGVASMRALAAEV
jgi:sarcosine oxidase subunit gamma